MEKFKLPLNALDARKNIRDGIIMAVELIAPTLGARGRKIVLDNEFGAMDILDDGAKILDEIELEDTKLQMGVKILRDAANKTNDKVGDGTSTTSILAAELIKEITKEENPLLIKGNIGNVVKTKKELNGGVKKVIDYIDQHKIEIDDKLAQDIGTISSNDPEIGKILAELFKKIGKDAPIVVSDSQNLETTYEIIEGMKMDQGFVSKAMVTDIEKNRAILDNPKVLVTDYKIQNPQDIKVLLGLFKDGPVNDLFIIADDIQGTPLDFLIANKLAQTIRVIGIKSPSAGDFKDILQDIAILCGATFISKENGLEFKDVTAEKLGSAIRVVSTTHDTNIIGGGGSPEAISQRIKSLEARSVETTMQFEKDKIKNRISKLGSGIGVIKVGGATDLEIKEKKEKIDDAISAVKAALTDGGIPGGGVMLLRASTILDENIEGEKILKAAIQKPFEQIIMNADHDVNIVKEKILTENNINYGFNTETGEYCDMVEAGVIDPALVAKTALQNAISIALLVLTISGANTLIRKTDDDKDDLHD